MVYVNLKAMDKSPFVNFRENKTTINGTIHISFIINDEKALVAEFTNIFMTGTVYIEDSKLHGKLENPSV